MRGRRLRVPVVTPLARLRPRLARLTDLKRVRTPDHGGASLAGRGFARSWAALVRGDDPTQAAVREAAAALVAVELAGIDAAVLRQAGLPDAAILDVFKKALGVSADAVGPDLHARLAAALPELLTVGENGPVPAFVARLAAQPRAGATHPTRPRVMLEPAESTPTTATWSPLPPSRWGTGPGTASTGRRSSRG